MYTHMIRKNLLKCKINFYELYVETVFPAFTKRFIPQAEVCPFCGASGYCRSFGSYDRFLIDFVNGHINLKSVRIRRVKCEGCGHTHAILPDFIIPYCHYSLPFILQVLKAYFLRKKAIRNLCEFFYISPQILFRWLRIYGKHKTWHLGALASAETAPADFLDRIITQDPLSDFLTEFLSNTLFSFLQNHANPANCSRKPLGRHESGPVCT